MIGILDYGLGNVGAFANMYREMGVPARLVRHVSDLDGVTKIILPGVGSFDLAMALYRKSGLCDEVSIMVKSRGVPLLGVCVGMQMLADASDEGHSPGLGWIAGRVRQINTEKLNQKTKLPHMGWNEIEVKKSSSLFVGLEEGAKYYFLHSYYFDAVNSESVLAEVNYGSSLPCAVGNGNIYGVQFHPEKSHKYGARLLKNFAEL